MRFTCWIPKATNTSSEYLIPIFSTATKVAQTRLSVTLYVRCFVQCKSHMPLLPLLLANCSSRPTMRQPNIFAFRTNNFQLRAVTVTQKIFAANEASPYHFLSFIHSVVILTACRQPIPKPVLHTVRLRVSSLTF